ncbi:DNA-directed RNA polymerase subunit delta [Alteribacillus iranensis]|uniref:Probable DNA-directed RNA polymerase subunit delta n=1 Tax=Alteribacillus iranensis TaxID=930128 RepID=A0A1I2C0N6_9BACI|nr:DNA-directed RNA polymerase subunit delta [Alteribacillus iranensis]
MGAVSITDFDQEQIEEMSAVELAYVLLEEESEPYDYQKLFARIAELKDMTPEEKKNRMTRLFTSLNLDGRFVHLGENHWGLRERFPLDQSDEDLSMTVQAPKRPKEMDDDEFEEDAVDGLEDIEDELDELSHEEDADDLEKGDNLEGFGTPGTPFEPEDDY